jgi:hypothetical protein
MDLGAVVQYVADSVKAGESLDLLLLNEMLGQMTGARWGGGWQARGLFRH